MYHTLAVHGCRQMTVDPVFLLDGHVIFKKWNIEPMESILQRKWNKSQDEVQKWFQREDITTEWLMELWEHGRDM